ncbi:hypothetical protein [Paraburkholderia sp.]|jgi:hypothetical protein|uniref:hypothetical protein n=1 Tax=Paraburkholderia sp. TaxID=1926495 RepID=UPI002F3E9768
MDVFVPNYVIREQEAVGALVVFGALRVIAGAVAVEKDWRISLVEKCFIALAALYCVPPLLEMLTPFFGTYSDGVAKFEGRAGGCIVALFCAPILSHRLGFE